MQSRKIFESDLQMLKSTMFESIPAGVVYNPEDDVVKNVDGDLIFINTEEELNLIAKTAGDILLFLFCENIPKLNYDDFAGIISMYKVKTKELDEHGINYLQGNFNTIRFAFTNSLKSPLFYRVKGDKYEYPKFKQIGDGFLMKIGLRSLVASPKFFAYSKPNSNDLINSPTFLYGENYVFTKQAIVFETVENEISQIRKISDSQYAREKNDKEERILKGLFNLIAGNKLSIPKVIANNNYLSLSNNYPPNAEMTDQLEDLHLEALDEIYEVNKGVAKVGDILSKNNYLKLIKAFKLILNEDLHPNGLSKTHLEDIGVDILTLMNRLDPNEPVFTSIFHGAFEPANCLKKDEKLYLNNFGDYETDKPLLFDVFHYIFYSIEKEQIPLLGELDDIMKHLFKNKALLVLIEKHSINFKLNLALFHIHHIVFKIESFLKQRFINPNVNFTLTFYKQSLERMNSIKLH